MFLWQKLGYKYTYIVDDATFDLLISHTKKHAIVAYDTETTGLNVLTDKPFLLSFGWEKEVYVVDVTDLSLRNFITLLRTLSPTYVFAHNAKYDFHMLENAGYRLPDWVPVADSITLALLTEYADVDDGMSLEDLGVKYVDASSKFAAKVIKIQLNEINKERYSYAKAQLKELLKTRKINDIWQRYLHRVPYLPVDEKDTEIFEFLDTIYTKPNYYDVYKKSPELMRNYAADDVVLVLELVNKLMPVLKFTDPDFRIFRHESKLISVVSDLEKHGFKADIKYLVDSHFRVEDYRQNVYEKLWELAGTKFSVGQDKFIKQLYYNKFGIMLPKTDMAELEELSKLPDLPGQIATLISELRTLDKWLSTYIDGMLSRIRDGRIYTDINNSGAVTGRVTSDLQQQPRDPLKTADGEELFHPRKVFVADEGTSIYYLDYSNMEMRVQAYYTIVLNNPDINMCHAFIPIGCTSVLTGEKYNLDTDVELWNSGEWFEHGKPWTPTDLHALTTKLAFPDLDPDSHEFKTKRSEIGKRVNFLKIYAGGEPAIVRKLKVSEELAHILNEAYKKAYPNVKEYQNWVTQCIRKNGFVESLYGRRYYIKDDNNIYKAFNYLIQGSCADLVKEKEIQIDTYLKENGYKTKMVLPIHDELQFIVPFGEEHVVDEIKCIMDDNLSVIKLLPMLCDVEKTTTNWAEKE